MYMGRQALYLPIHPYTPYPSVQGHLGDIVHLC